MDSVQQTNRNFYNRNAKRWSKDKNDPFYAERAFRIFLKIIKKGTVLDIGCAQGRDIPLFLGQGRSLNYEGLDISKNLLSIARSRYPHIKFYNSNILDRKTLPHNKYDGFWAVSTLQHIPEAQWDEMLRNISSIMKKGAIGLFSIPDDRPNPSSKEDPRHFSLISDARVRSLLREKGWRVIKKGTLPPTRSTTVWRWYIVST
jgi:SAM-dependent methyltransferase